MTPQSEDEVWRQIVASFNDTAERDSADQPWPDSENVPAEPTRRVVKPSEEFEPEDALDETNLDEGDDEEEEGHFEPPPPPPLPKLDLPTKLAWVALFGGPAYLLVAAMANWHMEGWALFTAVAAFIGGFVALVVRMGDGPPNDSGWDDGARL
ncbi:hypothetical protein FH608_025310 [Nonomuraea phyllanthi]|uniref:Uncharacterized protein n=1 Tax=Nonomuraea phyllanthi TaxID=2219224 RepID=A0A5C4W9G5_9ACTN|nr:hypothetical protein [Nonomuraea phyllanthi]KAB8192781.1 hypothetical protein FH608_025310 [Nonomuraea phyllanthi]QFY08258.1 hypothetical protein GBF35_17690 [Nonomuraea phyllanthi]